MRSADRALAALDFLVDAAPQAVRVTDVAQHLELSLATASRLLATLVERGYASRTTERRFTVGPRSVLLAQSWVASLRAAAAGPMSRASAATGETVVLTQLLGDVIVPIAWQPPRHDATETAARLASVTRSLPLGASATGRAMLAKLPASHRSRVLESDLGLDLGRGLGQGPTASAELRQVIRDGERRGLHVESGEADPDFWCCAVALERGPVGEFLALTVISLGEPDAALRPRIYKTLRRECRDVGYGLASASISPRR